jgi:thioredoxin-dependent peroxiredoxin
MIQKLASFFLLGVLAVAPAVAAPLAEGEKVPAVEAVTHAGERIALGEALKEGFTLVFFYPKADTAGCTAQACSLRDAYEVLTDRGVRVFGVSADSTEAQAAFKQKYNLPYTLLADEGHAVINAFGVPTRLGFASRQAFLVKDGVVVWRDLRASTSKQAEDALAALDRLAAGGADAPASS